MGLGDKISNKAEELKGKAKEAVGNATGNEDMKAEGLVDQGKAAAGDAAERVKDAAKDITGN